MELGEIEKAVAHHKGLLEKAPVSEIPSQPAVPSEAPPEKPKTCLDPDIRDLLVGFINSLPACEGA